MVRECTKPLLNKKGDTPQYRLFFEEQIFYADPVFSLTI